MRIELALMAAGGCMLAAMPAHAQAGSCGQLAGKPLGEHGQIESASEVAGAPNGGPGFCEVKATLSPVAGSRIGVVYRLPAG